MPIQPPLLGISTISILTRVTYARWSKTFILLGHHGASSSVGLGGPYIKGQVV